ncbi:MAG: SPOR domain-containing protein [Roseovarius sp.]|nr:SPOR domain-containing protein [Roseovarius sp.]
MKLTRVIAIVVIAASSGLGIAQAQSISSVQAPAEFPPASFKGRQYVDSKGCVFVRAGIDGNVSWIPRVSRKRTVICGFQPSIAGGGTTIAAAPKQAAEPVQITVAKPAFVKPAPKPAAKPVVAKPAAKPVVAKPVVKPVAIQPVQKPIIIAQPPAKVVQPKVAQPKVVQVPKRTVVVARPTTVLVKPMAQPTHTTTSKTVTSKTVAPQTVTIVTAKAAPQPKTLAPRQSACRGASALSSQYLTSADGLAVRCGPQDTSHVATINGGNGRSVVKTAPVITPVMTSTTYAQTSVYTQPVPLKRASPTTVVKVPSGSTRFVRENIYNNQVASTTGVYIPSGYKAAWEDDRLNTKRAHQTHNGKAQMELRWTNTVPRRLIVADTGQDAAYLFPGLQYPNTSYDQQMIAGVSASAKGAANAQPVGRGNANKTRETMQAKSAKRATTQATISTRSAAAQPQTKVTTQTRARTVSHRYVQAGMFGDMGNAQRAAQRLANAGLPTKLGKRKQNGKIHGVVVTGPFTSQGQLNAALQKVRGMGFGDAFLRK